MCDVASGIYLAAREVAEHLTVLATRLDYALNVAPYPETILADARALLTRRGDSLALALLDHLVGRQDGRELSGMLTNAPMPPVVERPALQ